MLFVLKEALYHVCIKRVLFFIFRFSDNHGHKSLPTFQTIINTYITQDNVPPLPPQSMLSHRPSITTQSKKLQALVQLHGILNEPYFEWSFWMILLMYQNNLDCGGRGGGYGRKEKSSYSFCVQSYSSLQSDLSPI